jgi:hypothetical protein
MCASDDDWDEFLLKGSNLCIEVREQTKMVVTSALVKPSGYAMHQQA